MSNIALSVSLESLDYKSDTVSWCQETVALCAEIGATVVIGTFVSEPRTLLLDRSPVVADAVQQLHDQGLAVVLIIDNWYSHLDLSWIGADDLVWVDYHMWRSYHWLTVAHNHNFPSNRNANWNSQAEHMLFLTGKPDRPNRVRLLWKLHRAGLLPQTLWSFFGQGALFENIQSQVPEESADDLRRLMLKWERNLDNIQVHYRGDSMHGTPWPQDPAIYQQSLFRLISESWYPAENRLAHPIYTEKTCMTLMNSVPWLMAGEPGLCKYLESLGFDSFQWALALPYDHVVDPETRMDIIVINAQHWLTRQFDTNQMALSVQANWHVARSMVMDQAVAINTMLQRNGIDMPADQALPWTKI